MGAKEVSSANFTNSRRVLFKKPFKINFKFYVVWFDVDFPPPQSEVQLPRSVQEWIAQL